MSTVYDSPKHAEICSIVDKKGILSIVYYVYVVYTISYFWGSLSTVPSSFTPGM